MFNVSQDALRRKRFPRAILKANRSYRLDGSVSFRSASSRENLMARPRTQKQLAETQTSILRSLSPKATGEDSPIPSSFSRVEWLAGTIRQRIVSGVYQPGERIREGELQKEFGFSNGPVREALLAIIGDGLAERSPWQGVRVIDLCPSEIADLFHVRLALLEYAAELAARRASPEHEKSGRELKRRIDRSFSDIRSGAAARFSTGQLGEWILTVAGNARLKKIWDQTMLQSLIYVHSAVVRTISADNLFDLHDRIIDAILSGEVRAARDGVRDLTRRILEAAGVENGMGIALSPNGKRRK
jgi:DNA-binding GntR family transcriptional regulator